MHALSVIRTRDSRNQTALDGMVTGIGKTRFSYTLWGIWGSYKRFWWGSSCFKLLRASY